MFKLESYITPLLMSYIDKYVKLKHEDFQLSLWGGDAVLNKLDLRLDAIEHMLNLPISFKSGHIYELRIHVPWTKLGSEPVVITINTIECIIKLRDYSDTASASSSSATSRQSAVTPQKVKIKKQDQEELPPGYLQSLITKVINNLNIVVNNLILKFVEDDIVLSVNAKSAECYSVDEAWARAFAELSLPELVLRKVINFHDLTVCLDRRNSDGKIAVYQDPLLYRCSLTCRLHLIYDSIYSSLPSVTKFNLLCDKLDISLTDTQLPMFCHLLEMCVAMYYGCLGQPDGDDTETSLDPAGPSAAAEVMRQELAGLQLQEQGQGWVSWAWSYVPQILPTDAEAWEREQAKKAENAILSVGLYITKGSISFKLTETHQETSYGVPKVSFHPCLVWEAEGISNEVLIQGLNYINVQFGITNSRISCKGEAMCGVKDMEHSDRDPIVLRAGPTLESKQHMAYDTNSLFDPGGSENQGERPSYICKLDGHMDVFTEQYGQERFGVLWMDYLYTMEHDETKERRGSSASHTDEQGKENSSLRFVVGPLNLVVSSSAVQRVHKMVHCALDHQYESYMKIPKSEIDEKCAPPTEEEVFAMEEFVATRLYSVTLISPCIWVKAADLPTADVKKKKTISYRRSKKIRKKEESPPPRQQHVLPVVVLKAERFEFTLTNAMYPHQHVRLVSKMVAPSTDLLHHCHSHMNMKIFDFCMGLSKTKGVGETAPVQTIVEPISAAMYTKTLLYEEYWKNPLQSRQERVYEMQQCSVTLTKAQTMLIAYLVTSWFENNPSPANLANTSLLQDVFINTGKHKQPVLETCLQGVEVRECSSQGVYAITLTLTSLHAVMFHQDHGGDAITPLLFGPLDTSRVATQTFLTTPGSVAPPGGQTDCITMTIQLPSNPNMPAGPAVCFIHAEGIVGCLDPVIHDWLTYIPQVKRSGVKGHDMGIDPYALQSKSPGKYDGSTTDNTTTETEGQGSKTFQHSSSRPGLTSTEADTTKQEDPGSLSEEAETWGTTLARHWPLLKIMHLQVKLNNICMFMPYEHLRLQEPTMNILQNLQQLQAVNNLPATLTLTCPALKVSSQGHSHKPATTLQEIPIQALDQSLGGDKTPWHIKLSDFSVYTITGCRDMHYLVKPAQVSATVAITTKYHPPTSDNITSLAAVIHADMALLALSLSQKQVQLLSNLMSDSMATYQKLYRSYEVQLLTMNPETAPTTVETLKPLPPVASSAQLAGVNTGLASTSSQWEVGEALPQTITGTSEASVSREATPSKEIEANNGVKLSLWVQWTLPKLLLKLYTSEDTYETCLQGVLEDLMTSVDLQEVFSKVKCKVEHVDVKHMRKCLNGTWMEGDHEGILLTSLPLLSREVSLAVSKTWMSQSQPTINLFSEEDIKPRDTGHGFLNVTFTRAQRKNVKKRMQKMHGEREDKLDEEVVDYLNEVCVNIQPCDIVINAPVIANTLQLFSIDTKQDVLDVQRSQDNGSPNANLPWLTSDILPLIYIDCASFRVFVPRCDEKIQIENGVDKDSKEKLKFDSPHSHDVLMLQVLSVSMSPQADNPLPRVIVNKEIYRLAMKSSISGQLGAELEDRQYQLDVRGLSLSTGCWRHLVTPKKGRSSYSNQESPVQHPALEWNNLIKAEEEREEIKMLPLASSLDLRIVAAPAIVYKPSMVTIHHAANEPSVVCGYSLEINATSDMDFFMSVAQIKMLLDIFNTNISSLITGPAVHLSSDMELSPEFESFEIKLNRNNDILLQDSRDAVDLSVVSAATLWDKITPFSVLLTAGKISCMLYSHKATLKDRKQEPTEFSIGSPITRKNKSKGSIEQREETMSILSTDSGVESVYSSAVTEAQAQVYYAIVPFLFATFSQPHTFVSVQSDQQRADLSCYDIVLKGTKLGYTVLDDSKQLPEGSDFGLHWIETRPGTANKKTGILPSLYTLSASNFLLAPAEVKLRLERPLKFNLGAERVSQVVSFVLHLQEELQGSISAVCGNLVDQPIPASEDISQNVSNQPAYLYRLSHFKKLSMTTTQIVVAMETNMATHQVGLQSSISKFSGDVIFKSSSGKVNEVDFSLKLGDLMLKTIYGNNWQTLIGPLPLSLIVNSQWQPHSGPAHLPRILCFLNLGTVPVSIGQENLLCFMHLQEQLYQCLQELSKLSPKSEVKQKTPEETFSRQNSQKHKSSPRRHSKVEPLINTSQDDLRSGAFSYITDEGEVNLLPGIAEITFSIDYDEGGGSMTWRYAEPRAITALSSQPVPYNLPRQLDVRYIDETMMVPCILQYYNPLTKAFEDYQRFYISGSNQMTLTLPEVRAEMGSDERNKVKVADMWRVHILHPKVEDSDYEFLLNLDPSQNSGLEPVIWPQSLAASLIVDSCALSSLVPALQVALTTDFVTVTLGHQLQQICNEVPDKLQPFTIAPVTLSHQPYLKVKLDAPQTQLTYIGGQQHKADIQFSSHLEADILEYRNLTESPLVERLRFHGNIHWQQHQLFSMVKARLHADPAHVRVSASTIHTLSTAVQAWNQVGGKTTGCHILPHHYLICNDTHHVLRIGQADTDESVLVESRHVFPYSWRTHKLAQLLHLTLEGHGGQWCEPIDLDLVGNFIRVIECKGQKSTLIICIKQITGVQKQVIISGQLMVCSRLEQTLEVKVMTHKSGVSGGEVSWVLEGGATGASCVVQHEAVQAVRVRLQGVKMPWSSELPINGDPRLVKIPLSDRMSFLHVWCHVFKEPLQDTFQTAVIFAPLFVARSHLPTTLLMNIETPRLKNAMQIDVKGQGQEEHLSSVSGDITHSITFQLSTAMKLSSPAISLSSGMSAQVSSVTLTKVDVDHLAHHWRTPQQHVWPYNQLNKIKLEEVKSLPLISKPQDIVVPQESFSQTDMIKGELEQPNIDLQIGLRQRWPGFNTLLIDIAPCWLLVNDTQLDFIILENNDHHWYLPSSKTFAPPQFLGSFRVCLAIEDRLHLSDSITMSNEERTYNFMADFQLTLFRQCHLKVNIPIKQDSRVSKLCSLVLHSVVHENMQVVTIRHRFNLVSHAKRPLQLHCYSLPLSQLKISVEHQERQVVRISDEKKGELCPLAFWAVPSSCSVSDIDTARSVQYMYFRHGEIQQSLLGLQKSADQSESNTADHMTWSQPMRVRISEAGTRCTVAVPCTGASERFSTKPYVVVCQEKLGMVFLTIQEEPHPAVQIHNHCGCTLHYGQTLTAVSIDGITLQEEAEMTTDLPTLPPGGMSHYAFPACSAHFPEVTAPQIMPKLHLAGVLQENTQTGGQKDKSAIPKLLWSGGIDLNHEHDVFVTIPDICDVKVHVEKVGHTTYVFVDPVGRAEVSAREIRSRIKGKETVKLIEEKKAPSPPRDLNISNYSRVLPTYEAMMVECNAVCKGFTVLFSDQTTNPNKIQEIMCITVNDLIVSIVPNVENSLDQMKNYEPHVRYRMLVALGDLQLDNQLSRGYDFQVLLIKENHTSKSLDINYSRFDNEELHSVLKQQSLLTVDLELCQDLLKSQVTLETIDVGIKPLMAYLEDTFLYEVLKRVDKCMPVSLSSVDLAEFMTCLPLEVMQTAQAVSCPVRLRSLTIQPTSMQLSLHASLKMFVALDNAPLSFGTFQRSDLFTTAPWLLHALLMHYVAATLFRAGWVVGSLEILGSPSGLVRHLGSGLTDLFRLPYHGIMRGPGAFLGGLVGGFASLVRNVSTGTLTSVTNFASSVSRNMDRLSLDTQHWERQEESRRSRPAGISDGLRQGITGFALSLLGAVAGLADQPLQTFMVTDASGRSAGRAATGLVSGLGKGLVGVVTKPLGGAADFVSQTGYGLLHGVGLTQLPKARCQPTTLSMADAPNSFLKYTQKILQTYPGIKLLMVINTAEESKQADTVSLTTTLLLTKDILFLFSEHEDAQQQAYALSQITCEADEHEASLLYISIRDPFVASKDGAEEDISNKDRVAAFVDGATSYISFHSNKKSSKSSSSDVKKKRIKIHVEAKQRNLFISMFNMAKCKALGIGFAV